MSAKILIVDDNSRNVRLLTDILEDGGFQVYSIDSGLPVLDMVYRVKPDIILLDIMMPGINGFEVCSMLKKEHEIKDIPVIMVTAKADGIDIKRALELGAFDYIKKPIDEIEVVARIQSALRFKSNLDKLKEMAMKDSLTGIYNHALLIDLFDKELVKHERKGENISFVMLDIDFFKKINDTYGHTSGDIILRELSGILTDSVRKSDIVGRYGGEEFGIVFPEMDYEEVYQLCERIRKKVEKFEFQLDNKKVSITISIGICFKGARDKISCGDMIKNADEALYKAKRNGRNRVEVYTGK